MATYPYLGTLGQGGSSIIYRPSLEIDIEKGGRNIQQMALIDSGSDITLMDADIATYLGLEARAGSHAKLSGITGEGNGFVATVNIHIEKIKEAIPLEVVFIQNLKTGILLGQKGLFEYFTVTFEKNKNRFSLERNTKRLEPPPTF